MASVGNNLPADVLKWSSEAVLEKLQLDQFDQSVIEAFQREAIDGESLMALTSDDLREMNLRLDHKKKIELMILSLKEKLHGDNAVPGCGASSIASVPASVPTHSVLSSNPVATSTQSQVLQVSQRQANNSKPVFDVVKMITSNDRGKEIYNDYLEREDHGSWAVPSCNDDFLRLLVFCILTMPEIKKIRRSSDETKIKQLLVFLPANEDIEDFVKNRSPAERKNNKQLFLLCSGSMQETLFSNLVIEDTVIPCGNNSTQAFNTLFASFFVFQVHYPVLLKPLFKLFEEWVFKISKSLSATTAEFISLLESPKYSFQTD